MKPRIINNGVVTEFETEEERAAYVALNFPTPDMTAIIKQMKREELGRDLLREIWDAFQALGITDANKFTLMQTITIPLLAISNGFFGPAKTYATLIPTDTIYTAGRKAALIALIDKYIAMVP